MIIEMIINTIAFVDKLSVNALTDLSMGSYRSPLRKEEIIKCYERLVLLQILSSLLAGFHPCRDAK